jgi:hypothetical protein
MREIKEEFSMSNEIDLDTNITENVLVRRLAEEMRNRGFSLLGVIGICENDGAVATLGDVQITQCAEFASLLHDLAQTIEDTCDAPVLRQSIARQPRWWHSGRHLARKLCN